jgi:ParB-like chromosome segregation protein Spo0J
MKETHTQVRKKPNGKQDRNDCRNEGLENPKAKKTCTADDAKQARAPAFKNCAPSYKVHNIDIDTIKVVDPHRTVNPEKVQRLVDSIRALGLRTPLTVRPLKSGLRLVAGLHRLEALKILGWKTVPCVKIRGGKIIARLWQIAENLHRADLTALEESEQVAEWVKLTESLEPISGQNVQKKGPGRPESGNAKAARELPVRGKTDEAKRKNIERNRKIARIDPVAKEAVIKAGLDNNPSKLLKIAAETTPEAQLAKVLELKARPPKPVLGAASDPPSDSASPFEALKREWKLAKKLQLAWKDAPQSDRTRFVTKVLKYARP